MQPRKIVPLYKLMCPHKTSYSAGNIEHAVNFMLEDKAFADQDQNRTIQSKLEHQKRMQMVYAERDSARSDDSSRSNDSDDSDNSDNSDREDAAEDTKKPNPPKKLQSWALVEAFGWTLLEDQQLTTHKVRQKLINLGADNVMRLEKFLSDRVAELQGVAYLTEKSRAQLLQLAALGENWFRFVMESPSMAEFAMNNAQNIDLEQIMG